MPISKPSGIKWRPVPGSLIHYVSSDGRLYSERLRRELRPCVLGNGYAYVCLRNGKPSTVHSLVLGAFIGPRPTGMETRHLDGNKLNNKIENLAYGTSAENSADIKRHGHVVVLRGEESSGAKLHAGQVAIIRALKGKTTSTRLGELFGVTPSSISRIWRRKTWRHV